MEIKKIVKDFLKEEDGLTTVEYAVAGGIIAAGVILAFEKLSGEVSKTLGHITTVLEDLKI